MAERCWRERNREVPGERGDAGGREIERFRGSGEMLEGAGRCWRERGDAGGSGEMLERAE